MQHTLSGKLGCVYIGLKQQKNPEQSNHHFSPVTNSTSRLSVHAQNSGGLISCMLAQFHFTKDPKISLEMILVAPVCSTAGITLY